MKNLYDGPLLSASIDLLKYLSKSAHNTSRLKAFLHLVEQRVSQSGNVCRNGRLYYLEVGQAIVSGAQLADQWDWDRKTVQSFLKGLAKEGYISLSSVPYGQIITFHNLTSRSSPILRMPSTTSDGEPSPAKEELN